MKLFFIRLLKSPLFHFILLGALTFIIYGSNNDQGENLRRIDITKEFIGRLAEDFEIKNTYAPCSREIKTLIDNEVMNEIMFREGVKRHLDQGDDYIRNRVIKKMNFVIEGMAGVSQPTSEQLQAFLDSHPDMFMRGEKTSFQHIFFSATKRSERARLEAVQLLEKLQNDSMTDKDAYKHGDPFLRGYRFRKADEKRVKNIFGGHFAKALKSLKPSPYWQGPVSSVYGEHLVLIQDRTDEMVPELKEIRADVYRAWKENEEKKRKKEIQATMLSKYKVDIEPYTASDVKQQRKG